MSEQGFRERLIHAINAESMEIGSDTPDWMLADYLIDCLAAYDRAVSERTRWLTRRTDAEPTPAGPAPDAA